MSTIQVKPKIKFLSQEYILVQAWKKAHDYIRYHNWYSDVLELDLTNADLERCLNRISQELQSSEELRSEPLRLVLAPKSQNWEIRDNDWVPVEGTRSVEEKLRPLAHASARDQIIGTAFLILLADTVESRQGDPTAPAVRARESRMVSYGHRLFCDMEDRDLRFRWGNSVVYRQYFQDYQAFISRPQEIVDFEFGESKNWAIVSADLSQFYDRVRPDALHRKIESMVGATADLELMKKFRGFFRWSWHPSDQEQARKYAETPEPKIAGFDQVALPQGLVASGFFSNAFLLDFDEAVCSEFDNWNDDNQWQLVDFCRYVDDMRIVIRLADKSSEMKEDEITQFVSAFLIRHLATHGEGLTLNPEKCTVILGRDAAAGSIRVSATMRRINHNTSGAMDLFLGEENIDLIEGLYSSQQEDPLVFEDKFRDTFFAAKHDVRDQTVARFAANRFRRTYRSLRPMCEDTSTTSDESLLPALSRETLDNKAVHFCRRLIERWVRDPSNMRLLRVALDIYPDTKALDVVLDLLKQYLDVGTKRKGPRRVAWYCAAELLRAGATETGLVADADCLPENINLKLYQEKLADFAEQIAARRNTYPWYLEQQAYLYLACVGRDINRGIKAGTSRYLKDYLRLHHILASRTSNLRREDTVPFVLLQSHFQGVRRAARTFLSCFREAGTPTQRKLLLRVLQENGDLADAVHQEMTKDERQAWRHLFNVHGIGPNGGFPDSIAAFPENEAAFPFLSVAKSAINPFHQEYAALHLARVLLKRMPDTSGLLFPARIMIRSENWRALCSDRFPISPDILSFDFNDSTDEDVRFALPEWVVGQHIWKYQFGQILRVLMTGIPDFTISVRPPRPLRSHVLYAPYSSSWMRRRYGHFNGRNAFGPPWLPISSWFGSLLGRLLEWPGFARFDFDFELPPDFDETALLELIECRIAELDGYYGRSSYTAMLPVRTPKAFMRPRKREGVVQPAALHSMRVGVVQSVIPRMSDFCPADPELNDPAKRRHHRRHLSAVLGGVHRMLQVRATHCEDGAGIELLVLPELSVHPLDVDSHLVPFVKQHRCMVFAGVVFHRLAGRGHVLVNSGIWIIPIHTPRGGLQIEYVEQGKWNLTENEKALGVSPFRPAQWILNFVDPSSLNRLWSMSGAICYDSTDLCLAADLRNRTDMFVVPALNRDVGTFDNMAASLHYHMFQHVIVANTGEFGGSTGQAPFDDRHKRTLFHTHGTEQVSVSFFEVDLDTYKNVGEKLKTPPAGHGRLI